MSFFYLISAAYSSFVLGFGVNSKLAAAAPPAPNKEPVVLALAVKSNPVLFVSLAPNNDELALSAGLSVGIYLEGGSEATFGCSVTSLGAVGAATID